MGFLFPAFLAALGALAVPIAMHLRNRDRNKPFRFPSLMFLERLPIRTAKRRRITDWPLLAMRALALALLVFAFARPVFDRRDAAAAGQRQKALILLIDRSMSMGHQEVWSAALDSARAAITALETGDKVAVVLFDDAAEIAQPLTEDHPLATAAVGKAKPLARGTRFAPALRAARQLLFNAGDAVGEIVVVSDLQRVGTSGLAGVDLPAGATVRAVPVSASSRANVSVAAVDARRIVNGDRTLLGVQARITARELPDNRRVRARLVVNGREAATGEVLAPRNGDANIAFDAVPITPGEVIGVVSLEPDALPTDDRFTFALPREDGLRALIALPEDASDNETMFLERALGIGRAPVIRVDRVRASRLDVASLGPNTMVLFWDVVPDEARTTALGKFIADGGGVSFLAGRRMAQRTGQQATLVPATFAGYADRLADRGGSIGDVRYDHALFAPFREATAALTASRFLRYPRVEAALDADVLARFDDGLPAVVDRRTGKGRVVLVAMPLDNRNGDFPLQPAFLPFLRRLVLFTSGHDAIPLWRHTGESWALPEGIEVPVVSAPDSSISRPAKDSIGLAIPLMDAGRYAVYEGSVSGEARVSVAVNVAPAESDLTPIDPRELLLGVRTADSTESATAEPATPAELERRQGLWRFVLAAVALLLVGETVFANRGWRGVATRTGAVSPNRSSR